MFFSQFSLETRREISIESNVILSLVCRERLFQELPDLCPFVSENAVFLLCETC